MMCCNTSLLLITALLLLQEAGNCRLCLPPFWLSEDNQTLCRLLCRRTLWLNCRIIFFLLRWRCRLTSVRFLLQLCFAARFLLRCFGVGDVTEHLHAPGVLLGSE